MSDRIYTGPDVRKTIDSIDLLANQSVLAAAVDTVLVSTTTKGGKRAFVKHLGNSVNTAGGLGNITFHFRINGSRYYPYHSNLNQWADPSLGTPLPTRFEVPQYALLEITADNAGAATYDCSGRIIVEYEDLD